MVHPVIPTWEKVHTGGDKKDNLYLVVSDVIKDRETKGGQMGEQLSSEVYAEIRRLKVHSYCQKFLYA